jgi:DNA-binding Xre family transcriptional regulator
MANRLPHRKTTQDLNVQMKPSLQKLVHEGAQTFDYVLEGAILSFTESVSKIMQEKGITKTDLATRLGCSAPYVTKIFRGNPNLTLQSLVKIAAAIDCDLKLEIEPKAGRQSSRNGHAVSAKRNGHSKRRLVRGASRN